MERGSWICYRNGNVFNDLEHKEGVRMEEELTKINRRLRHENRELKEKADFFMGMTTVLLLICISLFAAMVAPYIIQLIG